jgi:hypothetical protein
MAATGAAPVSEAGTVESRVTGTKHGPDGKLGGVAAGWEHPSKHMQKLCIVPMPSRSAYLLCCASRVFRGCK